MDWICKEKYSSNSIKTKWKLSWNQQSFEMLGIKFNVDLSKMIDLNYKPKLWKAKSIISNWRKILISPIGRVVVIKTLVLSLFTQSFIYIFTSLIRILLKSNWNNIFLTLYGKANIGYLNKMLWRREGVKNGWNLSFYFCLKENMD